MWRFHWFYLLLVLGLTVPLALYGQIDPEKRRLFQLGYNQPLEGVAPIAGYVFYYHNQPHFLRTNLTLRLAVAPVYVDSELGIGGALGAHTDLGIGLAGGGFADSYSEIRQGKYLREESFFGHGGEVALSLYHRFNPDQMIPLTAILRGSAHYSTYQRESSTTSGFVLPEDQVGFHIRTGLRWGGIEPVIKPALGLELSLWHETQFRSEANEYGLGGDRRLQPRSHLFWMRAIGAYTLTNSLQHLQVGLTAGATVLTDRLNTFRLGGLLPLASEFPLTLPGYYFQELSARRFIVLDGQYTVALDYADHWNLAAFAATAIVDYLPGLEQPGHWHSGVGIGLVYKSPSQAWQIMLTYAYGVDAPRSEGRGANNLGLLLQFDLEARQRSKEAPLAPRLNPNKLRGLDRIFGR